MEETEPYEDNPIILSLDHPKFIQRENGMKKYLKKALEQPFISFVEAVGKYEMGIYLIYDDKELLYIGMTERKGENRLKEILQGFCKHTFNRKLVDEFLRGRGYQFRMLSAKNHKRDLIDTGLLTQETLNEVQLEVNNYIKTKLRYKFFEFRLHQIRQFEHYAISTLWPLYND